MMVIAQTTVLIVEDEPIIGLYEAGIAEDAGFLTLLVGDAVAALRELEGPGEIHILLTDVNMPGALDGLQLADIVRLRWPHIEIIIASASLDHFNRSGLETATLIDKPFTDIQLTQALTRSR